ncbi:uncharacterized protein EAF01_011175 [Botrytis porri]|uniref:uncharacterized protein n=1 Tax=Botrytis porri TaxID=87229 RepID=UPI0018FFF61A|nr:uncharacterized protein EAF01_011175 [Botrytis porri]KAF7886497.1 hypothetical protein EAF01_011175 [Botrytis porri]
MGCSVVKPILSDNSMQPIVFIFKLVWIHLLEFSISPQSMYNNYIPTKSVDFLEFLTDLLTECRVIIQKSKD